MLSKLLSVLVVLLSVCPLGIQSHVPSQTTSLVSIQQTLALFAVAVDTKNYALFSSVFTPNVTANFSTPGTENIQGISQLTEILSQNLTGLISQHSLSTLQVNFTSQTVATSVQYLVGTFFGQGNLTGQTLSNYGSYVDTLLLQEDGGWLVNARVLRNLVSLFFSSTLCPL